MGYTNGDGRLVLLFSGDVNLDHPDIQIIDLDQIENGNVTAFDSSCEKIMEKFLALTTLFHNTNYSRKKSACRPLFFRC